MKKKYFIMILFCFFLSLNGFSQYLSNPSFEGTPQPDIPPPGWAICTFGLSTPDVQPGNFGVYLAPSDGNTYLGMTAREDFTWEDVHTSLVTPLSMDSCYLVRIDLAFQEYVATYFMSPITLKVYGHNTSCDKNNLLWQSPPIGNQDWLTYEFLIHPAEVNITDLVLEAYYTTTVPYWGYILMDNIRIEPTPRFDLGNDTILSLCEGDSLILDPGNGFSGYFWQDGSTEQTLLVDTTGLYWVKAYNSEGCSWTDSIFVTIEEYIPMESGMLDSVVVCEGEQLTISANVQYGAEPLSYQWQGLPDTTESIIVTADTTSYISVTITDLCGLFISDSIKLVVLEKPNIYLGPDTTFCEGSSLLLDPGSGFLGYVWQDSSGVQTYTVSSSGIYWVEVTNGEGCSDIDSIIVIVEPIPFVDLGPDAGYCDNENFTLNAGSGYSYTWQDGDTVQYYPVTQTGLYWVTVDNGCGEDTDSIYVEVYPSPEPDLGPDTTICSGASIELGPGDQYVSYLWQDNSTFPFYNVTIAGSYIVTVENSYGCFGEDEIYINISPSHVDLGGDQQICEGETVELNAGEGFISYLWQDNSTSPIYTVSLPGIYSVTVLDEYGCEISDTATYSYYPYPNADLGPDQIICEGDTAYLQAPEGDYTYYWNGEQGGPGYEVSTTGNYSLTVVNPCDSVIDEISISVEPLPEIYLGEDDVLYPGQTIELDAGEGFDSYEWQDGSGGQYYMITEVNIDTAYPYYYVEVTEGFCKSIDTIKIELYQIWVPGVITPNGDNENDIFQADKDRWSGINQHTMLVFNRWGEKVWESTDFVTGWDGKQNGRYVAEGTYFWILEVYYGNDNIKQTLKGSLTVIGVSQ